MMGSRIGFVGAGQLGGPTVEKLLQSGAAVRVFARKDEVRAQLRARGAEIALSLADVAAGADVIVVFVFSDAQLREVALGSDGVLAAMTEDTVLLVHTTASASTLALLAAEATRHGVHVVDGPVSGTADDIRAGRLTVLLGGDPVAVERCSHVARAYADPILHVGEVGAAMKAKLVNNVLFAAQVQLAADAARLAGDLGLEPMHTMSALMSCSGASAAMGHLVQSGDVAAFGERISTYLRKDVEACAQTADELSVELGLLGDIARNGPLNLA